MSSNMMLAISLAISVTFGALMPSSVSTVNEQKNTAAVVLTNDVSDTNVEAALPWWQCEILDQTVSGGAGVYLANANLSVDSFFLFCYETEGDAPGGAPTGEYRLISIRLSSAQ